MGCLYEFLDESEIFYSGGQRYAIHFYLIEKFFRIPKIQTIRVKRSVVKLLTIKQVRRSHIRIKKFINICSGKEIEIYLRQ